MGLFYNNNVAGSGVSKHKQKKPFFRFWEIFMNKFWVFIQINFIYLLFCTVLTRLQAVGEKYLNSKGAQRS